MRLRFVSLSSSRPVRAGPRNECLSTKKRGHTFRVSRQLAKIGALRHLILSDLDLEDEWYHARGLIARAAVALHVWSGSKLEELALSTIGLLRSRKRTDSKQNVGINFAAEFLDKRLSSLVSVHQGESQEKEGEESEALRSNEKLLTKVWRFLAFVS
jgi:hypothetical protein